MLFRSATFADAPLAGHPAVTYNRFGAGHAFYVATRPDAEGITHLMRSAWTQGGVKPVIEAPPGVEAVRRTVPGGSVLFLLNHLDAPANVNLPAAGIDLIAGHGVEAGTLRLGGRGVAVIHQEQQTGGM